MISELCKLCEKNKGTTVVIVGEQRHYYCDKCKKDVPHFFLCLEGKKKKRKADSEEYYWCSDD